MHLSRWIPMHLCTVLFHILEVSAQGHRDDLARPGTGRRMSLVHLCRVILPPNPSILIAKQ